MIGAYYKEQLIAFRAMLEPELDEEASREGCRTAEK